MLKDRNAGTSVYSYIDCNEPTTFTLWNHSEWGCFLKAEERMFLERSALKYLKFEPGSQLFSKGWLHCVYGSWKTPHPARNRQIRGKARGKRGKEGGGRKSKFQENFYEKEPGKV